MQDVQRFREGPAEVEVRVKAQAQIDGPNVPMAHLAPCGAAP